MLCYVLKLCVVSVYILLNGGYYTGERSDFCRGSGNFWFGKKRWSNLKPGSPKFVKKKKSFQIGTKNNRNMACAICLRQEFF